MNRRVRLLFAALGLVFFCRLLLAPVPDPATERGGFFGAAPKPERSPNQSLSARLPAAQAKNFVSREARSEFMRSRLAAAARARALAATAALADDAPLSVARAWSLDGIDHPDARHWVDARAAFAEIPDPTMSELFDAPASPALSANGAEAAGAAGVVEALDAVASVDAVDMEGGEYATLPLSGPIPMPGDPEMTAAVAEAWTGPPRELPARAAAAPAPENDAARVGTVLKRDENGPYREAFATVTAYCPCERCCGPMAAGITSLGKNAWSRGLAADPRCLSYGTRVYVPGYGVSVVDDTGGAMRRSWRRRGRMHIDIRLAYHWQARQWGRRFLVVRVYEPEAEAP